MKNAMAVLVRAVVIASLFLGMAPAAGAQSAYKKAAKPTGGPQEGIKVHGHWVIEVRNPDGTLSTRRQFSNKLTSAGAIHLAQVLGRTQSAGLWSIVVLSASGPCLDAGGTALGCSITEPADSSAGPSYFKNLTVSVNGGNLVLSGTATAAVATSISLYRSVFGVCPVSTAPSTPCSNGGNLFSDALITPAVPVSVGQIIQVTVTFSFS